jgi:predicted HTH domain antitoxin
MEGTMREPKATGAQPWSDLSEELKKMAEPAILVSFTVPLRGVSEEHRAEAERKAREAFIMELLRQGEISAGRTSELLGIDRWQLSGLMFEYHISPFDETMTREDLEREVAAASSAIIKDGS